MKYEIKNRKQQQTLIKLLIFLSVLNTLESGVTVCMFIYPFWNFHQCHRCADDLDTITEILRTSPVSW